MGRLGHVALWVDDIGTMAAFYSGWFGARAGTPYHNPAKDFRSVFLDLEGGCRLELMHRGSLGLRPEGPVCGYAHIALCLGSVEAVDAMAAAMRAHAVPVIDGPRWTGDGYYEAVVQDPEGNLVEITV